MKEWKAICTECGWVGMSSEILHATNPFDSACVVYGCPDCKNVNTVVSACDEPGCQEQSSCGTPTENGYRFTCGEHVPKA